MVSKQFHPKIESGLLRLHARSPYESLSSLSRYGRRKRRAANGRRERVRGGMGGKRETSEHSAADACTHRPAPFTCWCDMEVSESCEREMCMWDGARPGLRARREGRDTGRGSLTERRARGGGCVMICCLWPGSLSYFRGGKTTDKILFNSIYCASFGNGGLAFLFLNDQNK